MEQGQEPREYYRDEHGVHPFFGMVLHYVGDSGEPAFQNSWSNVGGPYQTCCLGKDVNGGIHLFGRVSGGPANTVIFILPSARRPPKTLRFKTDMQNTGTIEINANGEVKLVA